MLVAALLVAVLGPTVAAAAIRPTDDSGAAEVRPAATDAPASSPSTARESLLRLADTITGVPADAATGGYTYHRQRRWILDTTGTPAPRGMRENTPAVFAIEIQRWEANDGSGRGIDIEVGPDYTLAGAKPGHRSSDAEFGKGRTTRTDYAAGNRRSPITGPLASDPVALARQLASNDPLPDGPQATLRAVNEIYTSFYLDLPVRKATLRVLADLDGLTYHDAVSDRLGRTGVAVSLTSDGIRNTLIFDRASGRLLASEQQSVGAHEYLDVPHGLVRYYTLFVEQARRPRLG